MLESTCKSESSLSSYTILAVTLPATHTLPKPAVHYMYMRKDASRISSSNTPRSVFMSNIPIDASESAFRAFFKQISGARIEQVVFEGDGDGASSGGQMLVKGQTWATEQAHTKKRKRAGPQGVSAVEQSLPTTWHFKARRSGSTAVAVFVDTATANMVMKECRLLHKKNFQVPWTPAEKLGLHRYQTHHRLTYPPRQDLLQKVNAYLTDYAALEEARRKKLKQLRSEPDQDGFVTVVRGGRTGPARIEETVAAQERFRERDKKRAGSTFYRFQTREQAKLREKELLVRFEHDAQSLKEMIQRKAAIQPES